MLAFRERKANPGEAGHATRRAYLTAAGQYPVPTEPECHPQIRRWAIGRSNWLFAGSLRSGKRTAALMTLIQSARLNGDDPNALKDVLTRLPTQKACEIAELLSQLDVDGKA